MRGPCNQTIYADPVHSSVKARTSQVFVNDSSMLPDFAPGDILTINPSGTIRDGCQIVITNDIGRLGLMRKVRKCPDGSIELIPLNPAYEITTLPSAQSDRIVGVVVTHKRKFKRSVG